MVDNKRLLKQHNVAVFHVTLNYLMPAGITNVPFSIRNLTFKTEKNLSGE